MVPLVVRHHAGKPATLSTHTRTRVNVRSALDGDGPTRKDGIVTDSPDPIRRSRKAEQRAATTEQILDAAEALFSQHGTVESVALITDRDTGQPRGFGFVEMSQADAARGIQSLKGHQMDGRALKVNEAQAKSDRPRRF